MARGAHQKPAVTQRQIAENATKVACEPYYELYTMGNKETRLDIVCQLAMKLNPEGIATDSWKTVSKGSSYGAIANRLCCRKWSDTFA